jgi:uncharacterized protein YndB with AHSA1/START domain
MNEASRPATLVGDREILAVRVFDAPRDLVFKVWTDPNHIGQWWGPKGFKTTTFHMDVRPGGVWRFVMHGPDGRDYENDITYLEVVSPERLVYKHGGDKDTEPVNFQVTTTFEALPGDRTRLTMRMIFPSAAAHDHVVKTYGAVEGLNQTLGRLGEKLAATGTPDEEFIISRVFDVPRDRMFDFWTKREHLMRWFGPKGFTMTTANLDLRPGGTFHYCLRTADGREMWGKFIYREIIPPQRLVWVNTFSDAQGNLTRQPFTTERWPREMLTTVTFAEHQGRTTVTIHWVPINADTAERDTFHKNREGMRTVGKDTFEQLAGYLAGA